MAECSFMVQTLQLQPGLADATGNEVSEGLASQLQELVQTVNKSSKSFLGGGWEIASHDLTRIDRHLIVSFLLSRP